MWATWNRSGSSSTKSTRWGLPIETALAVTTIAAAEVEGLAQVGLPRRSPHRDRRLGEVGLAHLDADSPLRCELHASRAGSRLHLERGPGLTVDVTEQQRDTAQAVPAHLGETPVGVAVVHERATIGADGHPDRAVAADPEPAIAQSPNLVGRERAAILRVIRHDEVVPGGLVLPDTKLAHACPRYATSSSAMLVAPSTPASNHRIRGSRRNHAICRRTRWRVRLTV